MPFFNFGVPLDAASNALLDSGTQRKRNDFSSDVSSSAVLMRHQLQNLFLRIMAVVVFGPLPNSTPGHFFVLGQLAASKIIYVR